MSIDTYERLVGKYVLYKLLDDGIKAKREKKVRNFSEALVDIQKGLENEYIFN